jgi:hypothetical protein
MVSDADWHPQQAGILKIWEKSLRPTGIFTSCPITNTKDEYALYNPIIIISTVTGTANFAQGTFLRTHNPLCHW